MCVLCACVFMDVECYVCCVKNVYVELCAQYVCELCA